MGPSLQERYRMRSSGLLKTIFLVIPLIIINFISFAECFAGDHPSYFEMYWEARNDGKDIPQIFRRFHEGKSNLIGDFISFVEEGSVDSVFSTTMLIPDSRSLQRAHVNYAYPREVVVISQEALRNTLSFLSFNEIRVAFFGFAPLARQVEIISWIPTLGQYKFHILKNYGDLELEQIFALNDVEELPVRLINPNPSSCIDCHQHGGPIFTPNPWSETDGGSFPLAEKIKKEMQKEGRNSDAEDDIFFGIRIFDRSVRSASKHLQTNLIARDLGKGDLNSRKVLLGLSLFGSMFDNVTISQERYLNENFYEVVKDRWPDHRYAYNSSVLPDRSFDNNESGTTFLRWIVDKKELILSRIVNTETTDSGQRSDIIINSDIKEYIENNPNFNIDDLIPLANNNEEREFLAQLSSVTFFDHIETFSRDDRADNGNSLGGVRTVLLDGYTENSESEDFKMTPADPRFGRPKVGQIHPRYAASALVHTLHSVFMLNRSVLEKLNVESFGRIKEIAFENTEWMDELVKGEWPIQGEVVNEAILEQIKQSIENDLKILSQENFGSGKFTIQDSSNSTIQPPQRSRFSNTQAIELFRASCSECHEGEDAVVELPLNKFRGMRDYLDQDGRTIEDHLTGLARKMPPNKGSRQLSQEEKDLLIEWLRERSTK